MPLSCAQRRQLRGRTLGLGAHYLVGVFDADRTEARWEQHNRRGAHFESTAGSAVSGSNKGLVGIGWTATTAT